MVQKNNKNKVVSHEYGIKKSNELSMAKLNQGLSLNQMQLLAYAIYSTQQNGKTEFRKYEFQDKFGIKDYKTDDAYEDGQKLSILQFSTKDLENHKFSFTNVFSSIEYETGYFKFKWNDIMIPHILELKDKYVLTDLTITSKFKSSFSWALYDYLKAHYGHWNKELSKDAVLRLFGVEDLKSYQRNTSDFKKIVLDVAINELNKHTELDVWYTEIKKGRAIVGFKLHWSTGKQEQGATPRQVILLQEIHDEVEKNLFDYLSIKNIETARYYIIKIKEIGLQIKKGMSIAEADESIKESLDYYKQLENLIEINNKKRDTSVYFNWLKET